jgi:putative DNA primase/helicase
MPNLRDAIAGTRADGRQRNTHCPAHDDRHASLSVGLGADGRVMLNCHRGCSFDAVVAAAGLTLADLYDRPIGDTPGRIIVEYDYTDESGQLLFQVCRFDPKDFRQRRPDAGGGWIWSTKGVRRVLFGLPQLRGRRFVYVVEGEKDVAALRAVGSVATTNPGGAGKWRDEYAEQLRAAGVECVVVLPDNDDAGRQHAETVARSCSTAGLRVKVAALPNLPQKGDVSDWLDAGHTASELRAIVKATPIHVPATEMPQGGGGDDGKDALQLTALGDLLAEPDEPLDYLVQDRIAAGSLNLLAGKPKAGKSTASRALALAVARGHTWLGSRCATRPVWYLALEDKRSEVRRHFRAMGATGEEPVRFLFPQPGRDLVSKLQLLAARERPGLIIVDTLQRFIGAKDLNDYAEVTTKLTPILALARDSGAAVLLVHHAGKAARSGIDAVLGSTALAASVDNVFVLARTDQHRVLSSTQRIGPDMPETVITIDDTSGHLAAGPLRQDADRATVEAAILTTLEGALDGLTEQEIENATEGKTALQRQALRGLVAAGHLIRKGNGVKGNPYRYCLPALAAGDEIAPYTNPCSPVPSYTREQQNGNQVFAENPSERRADACSNDRSVPHDESDHREQESADRETFDL